MICVPPHIKEFLVSDPAAALDMFMKRPERFHCSPEEETEFIQICQKQMELNKDIKRTIIHDNILSHSDISFNLSQRILTIANTDLEIRERGKTIKIKNTDKNPSKLPKLSTRVPSVLGTLCLIIENLKQGNDVNIWDEDMYQKYRKRFGKKMPQGDLQEESKKKNFEGVSRLLKYCGSQISI